MYDYLEKFLKDCSDDRLNVNYVQISRDGEVLEAYDRVPVRTRLNTWSMSKGIVSCAVGIALDEGIIRLDEKLSEAYPEYAERTADPRMAKVTLLHLLTMTTGLKDSLFFCDGPERYTTRDWAGFFFEKAEIADEPGTCFRYSNFNTYMLSRLIENRTGQNLLEYLRFRLLEPMGMHNPDWTLCPMGHVHAANGLYFTADEITRYGTMLLNRGEVNGKQLVPKEYFRDAFDAKVDLERQSPSSFDGRKSCWYGYQFWLSRNRDMISTDGNYGQYCHVYPKQRMVLSVMSFEGRENGAKITDHIWEDIDIRILAE